MKLYEKFSPEELREILTNSFNYDEALSELGYTINNSNRKIIREIADKYKINLDHFINGQTQNLMGQHFGRLEVIKKVASKGQGARWLCRCECGQEKEINAQHLVNHRILSCGCLLSEKLQENNANKLQNLVGQRFGKLVVLSRAENIGLQPAWICQCDCGVMTHPIIGSNLRRGTTQSCGCLVSQGELKIREIFQAHDIRFKTQISFEDCLSEKNAPLNFDFGFYDKNDNLLYLLEYQGIQHYSEVAWTKESLSERQRRDQIKVNYCKEHNIPLILIPYTKYSTLNINDLIL